MPLDLSKLTDAVGKVASMATQAAAANTARDAALADLKQAQTDIDTLTATLLSATTTPAEAAGIAAVSQALQAPSDPAPVTSNSVAPPVSPPVAPPAAPVAPVTPTPAATFLPGDPRAPKATS